MPEESKLEGQENPVQQNYLDVIKSYKENTVPKEMYEDVVRQNKELLDSLVNGGSSEQPIQEEPKVNVQELRNKIFDFNNEMTNLEFVSSALQLRKAVKEETGEDIFVGRGFKLAPTREDYEAAERTANVLQEMVDTANGDADVFRLEFERRVKDVGLPPRKK